MDGGLRMEDGGLRAEGCIGFWVLGFGYWFFANKGENIAIPGNGKPRRGEMFIARDRKRNPQTQNG